jgi:hypothetical protein
MKVQFGGHAWHGMYLFDGETHECIIFAEDIHEAVKNANTLPEGAELIALEREEIPPEEREIDAPGLGEKLAAAAKRTLN